MSDEVIAQGSRRSVATGRLRLPGISSRAFEHPADRTALIALRKLPGLDLAIKKLHGMFSERVIRMEYLASAVRTSDRQFAMLHHMVRDAANVLDLDRVPEMYVHRNPDVNALSIGTNQPFIVLSTGLVDMMDVDELRFVIGHELGHTMSGHAVYHTMAQLLVGLGAMAAAIPLGGLTMQAVQAALSE
ncbi:MAG TPA: M48 family metallopeptidase, partial [Micromonosporaceae bacterium]